MLYSMQPLGFSGKKLWAQALKNSQKLLKIYINKLCNSQFSHQQPPLVQDKVITYGKSLSHKKQAQTELINIITLRLLTYRPKIHSGLFQIEQCLENLIIIYIQCSHQAAAMQNSHKKIWYGTLKDKKMCLLGRRGMLRVKRTLERPQLSSFNGQPNTPASILLGRMNKKHDIKRFKKSKTLNILISCFLFIRPSKMLAGVLGWPLKTKLFP